MRMRLAGVLASVTLVAVVTPAGASSIASKAVPTVLRGTVTMSGTSSWVRAVSLPKAVKVSFSDLTVPAGRGRFHGFILRADGRVDVDGLTPFAASIADGGCVTRGCEPQAPSLKAPGWQLVYPDHDPFSAVLPAGRYHLYFIADGAPTVASIHLSGLSGRLNLSSGSSADVVFSTPPPDSLGPQTPAGNLGQVYSAGGSHTFKHPVGGFVFIQQWKLMYGPPTYNHWGVCNTIGPPATSALGYHYQAPCTTTDLSKSNAGSLDGGFVSGRPAGPAGVLPEYETDWVGFGPYPHAGEVSTGGFTNTPDIATEAHTGILWVDYVQA